MDLTLNINKNKNITNYTNNIPKIIIPASNNKPINSKCLLEAQDDPKILSEENICNSRDLDKIKLFINLLKNKFNNVCSLYEIEKLRNEELQTDIIALNNKALFLEENLEKILNLKYKFLQSSSKNIKGLSKDSKNSNNNSFQYNSLSD